MQTTMAAWAYSARSAALLLTTIAMEWRPAVCLSLHHSRIPHYFRLLLLLEEGRLSKRAPGGTLGNRWLPFNASTVCVCSCACQETLSNSVVIAAGSPAGEVLSFVLCCCLYPWNSAAWGNCFLSRPHWPWIHNTNGQILCKLNRETLSYEKVPILGHTFRPMGGNCGESLAMQQLSSL